MNALPEPSAGNLWLVSGPGLTTTLLLDLGAQLARRGSVRFLDGGNRFNAYGFSRSLARELTRLSPDQNEIPRLTKALEHVHLARAFTCYQVVTLLAETPPSTNPTLVLDLLSTFYDESVTLPESTRLLETCFIHLRRLSELAPVVVSASPPKKEGEAERIALFNALLERADRVWVFEEERKEERQMRMEF